MPDRPPENPGSDKPPFAGAPTEAPSRSLSEILEELAHITNAHQGDASAMRSAVSELSRALARLFEMIRADRAGQSSRIAELEHALQVANARIAELEAGDLAKPGAAPAASDFDALRDAAERLRARTEQLVRHAPPPFAGAPEAVAPEVAEVVGDAAVAESADAEHSEPALPADDDIAHDDFISAISDDSAAEPAVVTSDSTDEESRIAAAREAVDASLAEEVAGSARVAAAAPSEEQPAPDELPAAPVHDEPFGQPGVLRVFPGAVLSPGLSDDLDIESELVFDEGPRRVAAVAPIPTASAPTSLDDPDRPTGDTPDEPVPARPTLTVRPRPEPIAILPRPARKRRGLRRRRIDARKLRGVDPAAALRAMVTSIDQLWTAGNPLDLVVALTDGGTLHVTGGDRVPLRVEEVAAGTSGRSTVTATSAQIVPLFGRLELDDSQSAPLIHGSRRDADLLAGWIDRAQRLPAETL